jgi:hypothetical protein
MAALVIIMGIDGSKAPYAIKTKQPKVFTKRK